MRRICFLFLLILSFYSWGGYQVLTTTTILYDLTKNIAGDKIQVQCLMPIGGDPHIYEPTTSDAQKVLNADLIIKNGLFLEGWLNKLIEASNPNVLTVEASKGIEPIKSVSLHGSPDPHAWMDPILVQIFVKNICDALKRLNPEYSEYYQANLDSYLNKLQGLDSFIRNEIEKIPKSQRVLITTHDAFKYFGRRYGVLVESAMGTSTDAEVQIGDLNKLISLIKKRGIPAIFVESTINPKLLRQVADDNGIKVGGSLFADSIGDEASGASTYLDMLKYNVGVISSALSQKITSAENSNSGFGILIFSVSGILLIAFLILYLKIKVNNVIDMNWEHFAIDINDVSTSYDKKTVLSNINITLRNGKLYGLLGPNGAGKSTLFKSILGLVRPDRGSITINGIDIALIKDKIAYIPQKEEIDWTFPATVIDIVLMGRLPYKGVLGSYTMEDYRMADDALRKVQMQDYAGRQIKDLSGGQQQRVFIARALCEDAKILMFDEPFVGVDVLTEENIIALIRNLVNENKTVVIIHHDLSKVEEYFDEVIMINQRLVAFGETKSTFTPKNISETFGARLTILQQRDQHLH